MATVTSEPVIERIVDAVTQRCKTINNILSVIRPTAQPDEITPSHMQAIVFSGDPSRANNLDCPGNPPAIGWQLPVHIHLSIAVSENDLVPMQAATHILWADCVKALTYPQASWHTWGGLAINSQIGNPEQSLTVNTISIKCVVDVWFRTDENNPYMVR